MSAGSPPTVLALDFDGVLCEGSREYFESSRRAHARVWPDAPRPADDLLPRFRELRPVIETGWEMPVLLRAVVDGVPPARIAAAWPETRDALLAGDGRPRDELRRALKWTLDEVRREWIAADEGAWLGLHASYGDREEIRRLLGEPAAAYIVTTKEGEFARRLMRHWGLEVVDVQGKETGSHKCENLRQLLRAHAAAGRPPSLWFVEDRLETLRCVTTHPDLAAVGLFLATWGYNTPETRASVRDDPRIRSLALAEFRAGLAAWSRGTGAG
jgi:phosphoglycolate phosphatase-like HAD superfamily hydrolase